jgi:methylenetetrahydrofolate--tRNA-(uracil-5-)-methyltransferase
LPDKITGCEGYVESASVGMLAGIMTACELAGRAWTEPPRTTALGALLAHITGDAEADTYQPMNINFGLFPPIITEKKIKKAGRKLVYTERAKGDLAPWVSTII